MHSRALAAVAVIVSLIAVAFVGFPPANAAPPQPHNFYYIARDAASSPLPFGTRITAWIDGVDYSNGTSVYVSPPGPLGNYDMDVFGDNQTDISGTGDNTPTIKTGGDIGDEIMFVAGDMTTYKALNPQQVFTAKDLWGSPTTGLSENLTLTLAPLANQPGLPKIGRIITQPNDPWPQYLFLCNPTTSPIDASQYYLEKPVPGSFAGPTHPLAGLIPPSNGTLYVNLTAWVPGGTTIATTGDTLKLVWNNNGGAFGTTDIIVDRVEFNGTFDPAVFVEPVNTIMTDATAPGVGQEIYRFRGGLCEDTNSNSFDFGFRAKTPRPLAGNTAPTVTVSTPSGGEDWTGNTVHTIFWSQSDAEDPSLTVALDYTLDGLTYFPITAGLFANGANTFAWLVPCLNSTTVRVRAQVFDLGGASAVSITNMFTIDCARPILLSTIPPDTQPGVDVNTDITLTFNEGMNQAASNASILIAPGPVLWTASWGPIERVVLNPIGPLAGNTLYTVTVGCGARDDSDTGNILAACPRTFTFTTTTADPAPTVDLTDPDGGEVWTGGSVHNIVWTMSDNTPGTLSTTLEYSTNGGGSWTAIITNQPRAQGPNSFSWTVPCPSTQTARVRVTAFDGVPQSSSDMSASSFEIDCDAPTVLSTSPGNNDINVRVGEPIVIAFSEDMEQSNVTTGFTIGISGIVFTWTAPDILQVTHNDFQTCTRYTATIPAAAEDLSDPGNTMGAAFTWSFDTACGPTVSISSPAGGESFSCASSQTLRFTLTDTDPDQATVFVWVNWTFPIQPPISQQFRPTGGVEQTVPFVVPAANTTAARITVEAQDSTGQNGADSVMFTIDCDPPSVLSSIPADGAPSVAVSTNFTITFSEPMDPTTTQAAISVTPSAGTLTFAWTSTSVLTVVHPPLLTSTQYTLSVNSVARDASSPGLALDPEYSATFTTSATGAVVADAGGPYSVQSGVSIQLDGSLSVAAAGIDTWSWEITAPGGAVSFASGERPNVQFAVVGQYTVLLRVTDVLGNSATDSTTLTVTAIGGSNFLADYWWLFVILILGVVGGLIFLLAGKRRKKDEETMPPEVPPEYVETVPPARATGGPSLAPRGPPVAPPVGAAPGKPMTRECPTCGTIVDTTDTECFMCGSRL